MRQPALAATIAIVLGGAPLAAQAPGQPAQAPAQPAAQAPAQPAAPPAPAPPRPFPEGAKVAFVNIQRVANESAEGKAATAKVKELNDRKLAELGERQKSIQAAHQKLQQNLTVLSDTARAQAEKDIERQQVELQRATQDAQEEVQELQQELQIEFQKKLLPVINALSIEKGLHMVFSQVDSGLVWADPGLDITAEVIRRFDQATGATAPKPPAK
jgi:outer membrane protein